MCLCFSNMWMIYYRPSIAVDVYLIIPHIITRRSAVWSKESKIQIWQGHDFEIHTCTLTYEEFRISSQADCMSRHCGRKPDYLEKTAWLVTCAFSTALFMSPQFSVHQAIWYSAVQARKQHPSLRKKLLVVKHWGFSSNWFSQVQSLLRQLGSRQSSKINKGHYNDISGLGIFCTQPNKCTLMLK